MLQLSKDSTPQRCKQSYENDTLARARFNISEIHLSSDVANQANDRYVYTIIREMVFEVVILTISLKNSAESH